MNPVKHPLIRFLREPTFQQLIASCRKSPKDSLRRGVLADWLEENGESEYAAYIRYEAGVWDVPEGYNYKAYTRRIISYCGGIFSGYQPWIYERRSIFNVGGLLTEIRRVTIEHWLKHGHLAYAIGCLRRIEISRTIWPMMREERSGSHSLTQNNQFLCDGFAVNRAIHRELCDYINLDGFQCERYENSNIYIVINSQPGRTQTKLTRAISNAAIAFSRDAAIRSGIACG